MAAFSDRVSDAIETVVETYMAAAPAVPGVCVAVDGPGDRRMSVSCGYADPAIGTALTDAHAARIASCTKTFVASTILDLAGRDLLSLDQAAIVVAPPPVAALLDRQPHGRTITVRHLLQHRSGLVDHSAFPEFVEPFLNDHERTWTPVEQLAIAVDHPPLFAPGGAFSYSDSGYVLLGQIIEEVTGTPLAAAVRSSTRLDELDVPSLHWERFEPARPGQVRAHQFVGGVDTHAWNPTVDLFGGGGIVATMPDLARWWTALFDGRVHPHLDQQIGDVRSTDGPAGVLEGGDAVGIGLFRRTVRLADGGGVDVWAHGGYWGLNALHVPAIDTSVAVVITARGDGIPGPVVLADAVVAALIS